MPKPPVSSDDLSMPVLLRHARNTYGAAMRAALADAGYEDIPRSGLYVIGGLALKRGGRPLSELVEELKISKQMAGQLVDTLVVRGYLKRDVDPTDRRRLTITLTERGFAAAKVVGAARAAIDTELISRSGTKDVERARRVLAVLADIGSELNAQDEEL
jgi:DNA-binding MarR family transcriptional regulator